MAGRENINNFLFTLFGFKKAKNYTHFISIIFVHLIAWCLFLLLPLLFFPIRFSNTQFLYGELLSKLLPIGFFYLNYYYLLPRFFERRRFILYFTSVITAIILITAQEIVLRNTQRGTIRVINGSVISTGSAGPARAVKGFVTNRERSTNTFFIVNNTDSTRPLGPPPPFPETSVLGVPRGILLMSVNRSLSQCLVLLLIGGLIRLGYSFLRNQNEKKALENAHLNAEVNFLKSQINPHFLFNTLNVIYSQAHARSENTEYSILKLSDLLRYVLYDSAENMVPLAKDIQYLSNYINLQRLRISQKINIRYDVTGNTDRKRIAPLLLITFVENAFKHGISYTNPSIITINISIFEKTLTLLVSNPVIKTNSFTEGGLGVKNVTRRLELLYPGKYLLDTVCNDHLYIVNLKINLDSD